LILQFSDILRRMRPEIKNEATKQLEGVMSTVHAVILKYFELKRQVKWAKLEVYSTSLESNTNTLFSRKYTYLARMRGSKLDNIAAT